MRCLLKRPSLPSHVVQARSSADLWLSGTSVYVSLQHQESSLICIEIPVNKWIQSNLRQSQHGDPRSGWLLSMVALESVRWPIVRYDQYWQWQVGMIYFYGINLCLSLVGGHSSCQQLRNIFVRDYGGACRLAALHSGYTDQSKASGAPKKTSRNLENQCSWTLVWRWHLECWTICKGLGIHCSTPTASWSGIYSCQRRAACPSLG